MPDCARDDDYDEDDDEDGASCAAAWQNHLSNLRNLPTRQRRPRTSKGAGLPAPFSILGTYVSGEAFC